MSATNKLSGVCVVLACLWGVATPGRLPSVHEHRVQGISGPPALTEYIKEFGYPVESHEITTEDGYILTYHRIPHGKTSNSSGGPPVLVQHGIMADSAVWVSVADSLGFALADAGFDVWLGNARGNTFSRKHIKYDPDKDKKQFWDFSWHEMGYYDLPASIDYILNATGYEQLSYAGHSMGTTMFFVLGAERPEYMDKVTAAVAMAPVAYLWHVRSPAIKLIQELHSPLIALSKVFGVYEVFPYSNATYRVEEVLCKNKELVNICEDLLFIFVGFDGPEVNKTIFTTYLEYLPGGVSTKSFQHYSQIMKNGSKFKKFDYGLLGNILKYGSLTPPAYKLEKVTAPMYIYYGNNDWLVAPKDAVRVGNSLPNLKALTMVANDKWNHLDFQMGTHAKALVYDEIVNTFLNVTSSS